MTIQTTTTGTTLTIILSGRLDTVTAPQLETAINNNINGITRLLFDLDQLDYISSAGLRILLTAQKTMNGQGTMELVHVNHAVMDIFEITGFTDILTIR